MKTILLKPIGLLFVFLILLGSCAKEPLTPLTELPINGNQKVINVEQNGIGVEFCLLNEQGDPATVFHEGENFKFHLAITNNTPISVVYMPISVGYGYIPDQFYVMNHLGDTIGRPFYFQGADYKLEKCPVIKRGENFNLDIPWSEGRDQWRICTLYAHGSKNSPLPKGIYFTSLTQMFCVRDQSLPFPEKKDDLICTDSLSFKINFEIK